MALVWELNCHTVYFFLFFIRIYDQPVEIPKPSATAALDDRKSQMNLIYITGCSILRTLYSVM
jgi:hypothetical protein